MKRTKSKVVVIGNEYGGVIVSTPQCGYILLEQKTQLPYKKLSKYIETDIRTAILIDNVERLVLLGLDANDTLPGKIVVKQQMIPLIEELPDKGLLTDENGRPIEVYGNLVYEHSYYTEKSGEEDVFIIDSRGL